MEEGLFSRLRLAGWRQFALVDIRFHHRLTVITGANGAGKSTLINILAHHFGSHRPYLATPTRDKSGVISFLAGRLPWNASWVNKFGSWFWKAPTQIGELEYSSGQTAILQVPDSVGPNYEVSISNQQPIQGIVIGSHRLLPQYQIVPHIPFQGIKPENVVGMFLNEANTRYVGGFSGNSLMFHIKQALAAWAAFGEGNNILQPDVAQRDAYRGFIEMLRKVLPESLGFIDLAIRAPDIVLITRSGEFMIDAASGGITTLIEIGALIYSCTLHPSMKDRPFVVLYDEPENHLHPQLQRSLFQNLVTAFPKVQFVVASHSPFIVSSLKDSNVYVLRYENAASDQATEQSRVVSQQLDYVNRAGNASEILREVLGLPNTLPQWVESDLSRIVARFESMEIDANTLKTLKAELAEAGLSELFPDALANLAKTK